MSTMYHMTQGICNATWFVLPMLNMHPDQIPRFRDCWIKPYEWKCKEGEMPTMIEMSLAQNDPVLFIYTRVGGNNRDSYKSEIEQLRNNLLYLHDYDDKFDATYATFVFKIPREWWLDFQKIKNGELTKTSKAYQEQLYKIYPKLIDRFDKIFKKEKKAEL